MYFQNIDAIGQNFLFPFDMQSFAKEFTTNDGKGQFQKIRIKTISHNILQYLTMFDNV